MDVRFEKEIDKMQSDIVDMKETRTVFSVSLQKLKEDMEKFMHDVCEKIDKLTTKVDEMHTCFSERLTRLEKTFFALKWGIIGGVVVLVATTGGAWLPLIIQLFGG